MTGPRSFRPDEQMAGSRMRIGYIVKKNMMLSKMAELYIRELDRYLKQYQEAHG